MFEEEMAPLNAQIEQTQQKREALENELGTVEAELEKFSAHRQRFDALRNLCDALDQLRELNADELFWKGIPEIKDAARHMERVRGRVAGFDEEIRGILAKQASLQEHINQCSDELDILDQEVRDAYDREERRREEFVIEREISSVPYRAMIMPWTKEAESERSFRRAVLVVLVICFVIGMPISMIKLPIPDRSTTVVEIPKRLAKMVKNEFTRTAPVPKPMPKQAQKELKESKEKAKAKPEQHQKPNDQPKGGVAAPQPTEVARSSGGGAAAARKKAQGVGILAFTEAFGDLMEETPVAKLGTEARLSNESPRVRGRAVAQRSLVAVQAQGGSSGGIGNASVSRNIGNGNVDRLGGFGIGSGGGSGGGIGSGTGFGGVQSAIANLEESSRPLSDGLAAGRTDEEIQIVFDRYKATLYRIYNRELRKDPTLRGKILLRISIQTNGAVSMCKVESTDLASPELVAKIVERIKRFNFGPKEGVPKITILYPIDFLPAG
jgi:outer membrane biosynthesis protein TonB